MAISNFISTVWSETLYEALEKKFIAVRNCNRDFDGDIKEQGSTVKICGVGDINVFDYKKNTDMSNMQTLTDTVKEIYINRARAFNFQIDDIDRAQSNPQLMKAAMKVAAAALANDADRYIYSIHTTLDGNHYVTAQDASAENILDYIIAAREKLYAGNVTNSSDIVLEVSPPVASLILKAKILNSNDTSDEALSDGVLGTVAGCKVFVSNNIDMTKESGEIESCCYMRTKRAIAFANQLSEIEAYRPESRFADAVKGLHLYGAEIVYPEEIVVLDIITHSV